MLDLLSLLWLPFAQAVQRHPEDCKALELQFQQRFLATESAVALERLIMISHDLSSCWGTFLWFLSLTHFLCLIFLQSQER